MSTDGYYADRRVKLQDEIPEAEWSDARKEYYCEGKTVSKIADEHYADERVISQLIQANRPFSDIGVRKKPTVIHDFKDRIEELLKSGFFNRHCSITTVTRKLYEDLAPRGYCGKERSLRNYVKTLEWEKWIEQSVKNDDVEQLLTKCD